jgi:hypothetical protein
MNSTFQMTNSELLEALMNANAALRQASPGEVRSMWVDHLARLLEIQATRALIFLPKKVLLPIPTNPQPL